MVVWLQRICVWLLVLAVPAQAGAAAARVFCGSHHHAAFAKVGVPLSASTVQAVVGGGQGAQPSPCEHHAAALDAGASGLAEGAMPLTGADDHDPKCSACAACCFAAAIVDTVAPALARDDVVIMFASLVQSVHPFAVAGPERPPRGSQG